MSHTGKDWNEYSVASCIKPYKEVIWIVSWGTTPRLFIYVYLLSDIIRLPYFDARPVKCDTGRWCSVKKTIIAKPPFGYSMSKLSFWKLYPRSYKHTLTYILNVYTINGIFAYIISIEWHYNKGRLFSFFQLLLLFCEMKMKCWAEPHRNRRGAIHHII